MIVSVDAGRRTAVALHRGPAPAVTTFTDASPAEAHALLSWVAENIPGPHILQIEDQHAKIRMVKRRGRMQPTIDLPALIKLIRAAEVWAVVGTLLGFTVVRTLASTWQGPMLPAGPGSTKQRARKAVASTWQSVRRFAGTPASGTKTVLVARLNEHERDALLMGRWLRLYGGMYAALHPAATPPVSDDDERVVDDLVRRKSRSRTGKSRAIKRGDSC